MNYLAHGVHVLDEPLVLAGTALPGWLSALGREFRVRTRHVEAAEQIVHRWGNASERILRGVRRHFSDDDWFHSSGVFEETMDAAARLIRSVCPGRPRLRASFLGHVGSEMLLDASLVEEEPQLLTRYYDAVEEADADDLEDFSARLVGAPRGRLTARVRHFLDLRFLGDYLDDGVFFVRLGQVAQRVGIEEIPGEIIEIVPRWRELVRSRANELLTPQSS